MKQDSLLFLKNLLNQPTPSGYEQSGQEVIRKEMLKATNHVTTDSHGNVHGVLNPDANFRIMLAGHCDEIGLMITFIDEKGMLWFQPIGGVNLQLLQGQRVIIYSKNKPINGVIGVNAIHTMTQKERESGVTAAQDLWIDIGAKNKKEAAKLVEIGDIAVIDVGWFQLQNDYVAARGFDDRIGAFIITEVLKKLSTKKLNAAIHAVSTVQEEIGLRGATTAANAIMPHVGFAVDVGFATDFPKANPKITGEASIGQGAVILRGPNVNPHIFKIEKDAAKKIKEKYQITAFPRGTGTDGNAMQLAGKGCAVGILKVPLRYMHSPVEVISLADVQSVCNILTQTILDIKPTMKFEP